MNTETRNENNNFPDSAKNKERNILSANLAEFTVNQYLGPYLSQEGDNPFISNTTAGELKQIIPQLIDGMLMSTKEALGEDAALVIGGSSMEVFSGLISPEYYWRTKRNFIDLLSAKQEIIRNSGQTITQPLETLAYGDADLDLYVEKVESLDKIFDKFHNNYPDSEIETIETEGRQFKIKLPNSDISLTVYAGPMQNDSSRERLYFRLKNNQGKPLFHVDITNKEILGDQAFDRRKGVGSIHDYCQGRIDLQTGMISVDKKLIPQPEEQSTLQLEEKDIKTIPEIVMREVRKKLFHVNFKTEANKNISIYQLFPLLKADDIFYLRELTSDPKYRFKETIESMPNHQKNILYRELFLMANADPYLTVIFLQDTGFDSIFFGRHFSRREGLKVLASPWLKIEYSISPRDKQTNTTSVEDINKSREEFIKLQAKNPNQNGFIQLASAVGHVFGPNPVDFESHFKDGLGIIENPKLIPDLKPRADLPSNDRLREMYGTIVSWGSLTEKSLHSILNIKDPNKFPNEDEDDLRSFKYNFFKLKTSGLLEVAKRKIITGDESIPISFYYPTDTNKDIVPLLPFVEESISEDLSPRNQKYWKNLSARFPALSETEPEKLAYTWRFLTLLEIKSMEALLTINKFDIEAMNNLLSGLLPVKPSYEDFEVLRKFLILRQTEINQSWFDSQLNI